MQNAQCCRGQQLLGSCWHALLHQVRHHDTTAYVLIMCEMRASVNDVLRLAVHSALPMQGDQKT